MQRDDPSPAEEHRCPACGDLVDGTPLRAGTWTYLLCPRCGSAWLHPQPDLEPADLYDAGYFEGGTDGGYSDYAADEDLHRRNAAERLALVQRRLGGGGAGHRLLDVGCAHGYLLDEAVAAQWDVTGVEVSAHARRAASDRGHQVVAALDDLPHEPLYDAVGFFQVLEHLADPAHALSAAVSRLRHGGVLVVETWDRSSRTARLFGRAWQQINPPTVLHLFTEAGLRRLLLRDACTAVDVQRTTKVVSLGLAASVVAHRLGPLEGPVRSFAQRPAIAGRAVRYPLDDLVTATALRA